MNAFHGGYLFLMFCIHIKQPYVDFSVKHTFTLYIYIYIAHTVSYVWNKINKIAVCAAVCLNDWYF